ncbi:hypothetical protein GCM10010174_50730 [Kutzneria viridogrisea]
MALSIRSLLPMRNGIRRRTEDQALPKQISQITNLVASVLARGKALEVQTVKYLLRAFSEEPGTGWAAVEDVVAVLELT